MEFHKKIGQGSYGNVFIHPNNKNIAIKKSFGRLDYEVIMSYLTEVVIMKELNHPNIIKCIDYEYNSSSISIYMKKYHTSLQKLLKYNECNNIRIPTNIINKMLLDILSGLEYLHENNILHLDLSDDNILLKNDYTCVIIDFGLSSLSINKIQQIHNKDNEKKKKLTQKFPVFKNPFAAPEILEEQSYDEKADIWAFGVIMIMMFNNKYIFNNIIERKNQIIYINNYLSGNNIEKEKFLLKNMKRDLDDNNTYLSDYDITQTHIDILLSIFKRDIVERSSSSKIINILSFYETTGFKKKTNHINLKDAVLNEIYLIEYGDINNIIDKYKSNNIIKPKVNRNILENIFDKNIENTIDKNIENTIDKNIENTIDDSIEIIVNKTIENITTNIVDNIVNNIVTIYGTK